MQKNNNIYHNKQRQNILWLEYMSYIFYILELLYIIYSIYTTYQNYQNIIFYNGKGDIIWRFHCHTYFRYYIYENFFLLVYLDKWVFFCNITSHQLSWNSLWRAGWLQAPRESHVSAPKCWNQKPMLLLPVQSTIDFLKCFSSLDWSKDSTVRLDTA